MASLIRDKNGSKRIQLVYDGKRRTIRLGDVPVKAAEAFKLRVESLAASLAMGSPIDAKTAQWLGELSGEMHDKLVRVDLVESRERRQARTLGELIEAFENTAVVKRSTMLAYRQTTESLIEHFGADRELAKMSAADAEGWRRAITDQGYAPATIAKRTSAAKSLFRTAVRWEWMTRSPFADLRPGSQANPDRAHYISIADTARLIEACPSTMWRAIVGLTRYAGLRCPSELGLLRWGDVDWDRGALTVRSPKTAGHEGHAVRQTPIVPELRAILADLFELAEPGVELILPSIGTGGPNLRTQLRRIISRAGFQDWPRLFQNLRASCATDWAGRFPQADAARWLGHSPLIAARHYHQARDEHFRLATTQSAGGAESGALVAQTAAQHAAAPRSTEPPNGSQSDSSGPVTQRAARWCGSVQSAEVGDTGLEPVTSSMSTRRASQLRQSPLQPFGGTGPTIAGLEASRQRHAHAGPRPTELALPGGEGGCLGNHGLPAAVRYDHAAGLLAGDGERDNAAGPDGAPDGNHNTPRLGDIENAPVDRGNLQGRAA